MLSAIQAAVRSEGVDFFLKVMADPDHASTVSGSARSVRGNEDNGSDERFDDVLDFEEL